MIDKKLKQINFSHFSKVKNMKLKKIAIAASASCFVLLGYAQQAKQGESVNSQEVEQLSKDLQALLTFTNTPPASLNKFIGAPGTTFGTPSAYGASRGQGFVGVSGIYDFDGKGLASGNGRVDGSVAVGVGFGDPVKAVGVELMGTLTSINPKDGTFGDSGQMGVKVHRLLDAASGLSIALASTDFARWGEAKLSLRSTYVAMTGNLPIKLIGNYPVSATLGAGNGNYRPFSAVQTGQDKVGAFASIGTQLTERTSLSLSHLGGRTNLGVGITPFDAPISVMVGLTDIDGRSAAGRQLNVNVGYAFKF